MWLKICDSHLTCKVANKCLNVRERVEVVEWNKRCSPPFSCCPVSRQGPWNTDRKKKFREIPFNSVWSRISWSEEQLAGSDRFFFSLINLVPRVPSFYVWPKFRLKNRVTTVHLLQCKKISSLIYAFEGEIYGRLKNIHLRKPPLIPKKSFFDLFAFVYIRPRSSSFV